MPVPEEPPFKMDIRRCSVTVTFKDSRKLLEGPQNSAGWGTLHGGGDIPEDLEELQGPTRQEMGEGHGERTNAVSPLLHLFQTSLVSSPWVLVSLTEGGIVLAPWSLDFRAVPLLQGDSGQLPPRGLGLPSTLLGGPPLLFLIEGTMQQLSLLWAQDAQARKHRALMVPFFREELSKVTSRNSPSSRSRSQVPRRLCFCGLVFSKPSHCPVGSLRERNWEL